MQQVIMYQYLDLEPEEVDSFEPGDQPTDETFRGYVRRMLEEYRLAMATHGGRVWLVTKRK
jgi:hypothetical protein